MKRDAIARALGSPIVDMRAVGGGDINEAWRIVLADGRLAFAKTNDAAPPDMFEREAEGLAWLAEANALRIPEVLAVGEEFLVLELIEPAKKAGDFGERLGRGLAALHRFGADRFGWTANNYIGNLPQDNEAELDWPTFYGQRRLMAQLEMAIERGRASAAMRRDMAKLVSRLTSLVGPSEPPSRLHGDLWAGNCHVAGDGAPVLIDPAVYGGHREMDLAMMKLFGGFSDQVFAAYDEAWPLAEGWRERISLYQLYPLMVHVNLFGGSYVASVERVLSMFV